MRQPESHPGLSQTAMVTIVLVVVFGLECINDAYLNTEAESWLALTIYGLQHGWVWQLFTFQILHANLMHLVFNLIGFWWLRRWRVRLRLWLGGGVCHAVSGT